MVAVVVLKAESAPLNIDKLILASKMTMGHYKSDKLNIIYKNVILSMIINTRS